MSKLSKIGHFFLNVGHVAPLVLLATPLAPIAPMVAAAVQEAEAMKGDKSGAERLAHAKAIAIAAAEATNVQAGKAVVDVEAVKETADAAISAVVQAAKASDAAKLTVATAKQIPVK